MNTLQATMVLPPVAPDPLWEDAAIPLEPETLELIEAHRGTRPSKRRGWLVRRALLTADLVGLSVAFLVAELLFGLSGARSTRRRSCSCSSSRSRRGRSRRSSTSSTTATRSAQTTRRSTSWRRLPPRHGRRLALLRRHLDHRRRHPEPTEARRVLGARDRAREPRPRASRAGWPQTTATYVQNTIIVGAGDVGQLVARKLRPASRVRDPPGRLRRPGARRACATTSTTCTLLGARDALPTIVQLLDVERVIVAFSSDSHEKTLGGRARVSRASTSRSTSCRACSRSSGPNVGVHTVEGLPLIGLPAAKLFPFSRTIKRAIDIVGAATC